MASKQEIRSAETKKNILQAAGRLFSTKGYDAVTMREIAKEAGCSHTTIYIYFKDKEVLLHQLSMPPLLSLMARMDQLLATEPYPEAQLKTMSLLMIEFCLTHRNMYSLFFNVKSIRVDHPSPEMELNQLRNNLFSKLRNVIAAYLNNDPLSERSLMYSRIYFFTLNGIISTYASSEETVDQLMERLRPTFEHTFEVLLKGIDALNT
ncbi:AcrR family transcriptional regulator [Paenibacillus turicensis]|uniref:AcrR family transcriptional regulator n=1 Tax=Paenibacillus turicensis TaxID=160487 RepID=A0ABS4FPM6_9BACL|nr:TetR/AcrR family transcriptional regulator [Paenibacillus turicensis]MBP1904539.1 AcrR family transcriptional regulator [Paenibacillus turicensis]